MDVRGSVPASGLPSLEGKGAIISFSSDDLQQPPWAILFFFLAALLLACGLLLAPPRRNRATAAKTSAAASTHAGKKSAKPSVDENAAALLLPRRTPRVTAAAAAVPVKKERERSAATQAESLGLGRRRGTAAAVHSIADLKLAAKAMAASCKPVRPHKTLQASSKPKQLPTITASTAAAPAADPTAAARLARKAVTSLSKRSLDDSHEKMTRSKPLQSRPVARRTPEKSMKESHPASLPQRRSNYGLKEAVASAPAERDAVQVTRFGRVVRRPDFIDFTAK
eukprot:GHVT01032824.1.p1 GENE.GHVT01032824.1~~GHVT01032824.1.p1  ORF type:complete len:282 (+),score=63.84 GHVT01032824.1:1172-2017(+)